ncbi:MAG: hypothetical protein FWD78_16625 [Treponema sp.]|nr:hypothetical protein [Treponema sp.]
MEYKPTSASAIEFSKAGKLEDWIHLFLCGEGKNRAFSEGLKLELRKYYHPKMLELNRFERCCGPEEEMKFKVPEKQFNKHVNEIALSFNKGDWDMPPLIINMNGNNFVLNDGNHRFEALKKLGVKKYWIILWETISL